MNTQFFADMAHLRLMTRLEGIPAAQQSLMYHDLAGLIDFVAEETLEPEACAGIRQRYATQLGKGTSVEQAASDALKTTLMALFAKMHQDVFRCAVPETLSGFTVKTAFDRHYRILADGLFDRIVNAISRLISDEPSA